MSGLIERNVDPNEKLSKVSTYEASEASMGAGDSVEDRVASITSKNSPLMQMSRTRANQAGNKRGLLNSSMTMQAGEAAVYDTALPIASQDASTSANFKLANQNAKNTAGQFNSGQVNQARGLIEQGRQSMEQIQETGSQTRQSQNNQGDITSTLQKEGYDQDLGRITTQGDETRKNIEAQGGIEKYLQSEAGQQALAQIEARGGVEKMLLTQQGQQALAQIDASGQIQKQLQKIQGQQALSQISAQGQQTRQNVNLQGEFDSRLQNERHQQTRTQLNEQFGYDKVLQKVRGDQAERLTQLENANSLMMQTSQSTAIVFGQHAEAIGNILSNSDIPAESKQGLVDKQIKLLENAMAIQGSVSGTNLKDLLDFGGGDDTDTEEPGDEEDPSLPPDGQDGENGDEPRSKWQGGGSL